MERIFETKCGKIKGLEFEDRIEIKNVVYAYAERFSYPSIATKWEGIIDGTKDGDNVYQEAAFYEPDKNSFYEKEFSSGKTYTFSENHLTLTITAPKGEKLPVLLFIHGGGYETGMVNDLPYGGSLAYVKRGVILVSVSYRMNVFGLYNDSGKYAGNYGLADQIAAIKWVRDNVSAFGGDPSRITIIGQSAGAMSVDELCYVSELDGIIKGAIMMSGLSGVFPFGINFTTAKKSRKFWRAVELLADCKNGDELKVTPAKRVFDAWKEAKRKIAFPIAKQFPIIDGKFIKASPKKLYEKKERLNIPYIFGVTSQDMLAPDLVLKRDMKWAKLQSERIGSPVYGYFFDKTPAGNSYKAFHGVDLWYVFGQLEKSWRGFEKPDYDLHELMADNIASFVKTGKPQDNWLTFDERKLLMRFDESGGRMTESKKCLAIAKYNRKHDKGPI